MEEHGYSVVVFESSIYGALIADREKYTGRERLFQTLPTIWRTPDLLNLFHFLDESSTQPQLYGVDPNGPYDLGFSRFLRKQLQAADFEQADELFALDSVLWNVWLNQHQQYGKHQADDKIHLNDTALYHQSLVLFPAQSWERQCLQNRIYLIQKMQLQGREAVLFRDSIMALNAEWVLNQLEPNTKVILWAADMHLSYDWKAVDKKLTGKSMMMHLKERSERTIRTLSLQDFDQLKKSERKLYPEFEGGHLFVDRIPEPDSRSDQFDAILFFKNVQPEKNYLKNEP
ncbi:erythromycin esterase family protein [bacterium SCSIO 12741]|nr:erythromycin esterase family protein [bacterium SCSIO 12741]